MATLHKRLTHYSRINRKPQLTPDQKQGLGRIVIEAFCAQKKPEWIIHHAIYTNEEGTFRVVAYPKWFVPKMDQLIEDFYKVLYPPPPKRKRIPAKSNPIYSTKK